MVLHSVAAALRQQQSVGNDFTMAASATMRNENYDEAGDLYHMNRIRVFIMLALAITVGGAFAFATYRYTQKPEAAKVDANRDPAVVIAVGNLDLGASLRREDVRTIEWPAESVPAGAFNRVEDVIGRGLIQPVRAERGDSAQQACLEGRWGGTSAGDQAWLPRPVRTRQ
jgi:hypothetical protein